MGLVQILVFAPKICRKVTFPLPLHHSAHSDLCQNTVKKHSPARVTSLSENLFVENPRFLCQVGGDAYYRFTRVAGFDKMNAVVGAGRKMVNAYCGRDVVDVSCHFKKATTLFGSCGQDDW